MARQQFHAICFVLAAAALLLGWGGKASAEGFLLGEKTCLECHGAEHEVWKGTKHFSSFREVHRADKAKGILKAVGAKRMKGNETCTLCHYSMEQKSASAKARAKSGPGCESCHSPASEWLNIHNNYGGPNVKRDTETPEHRAQRLAQSAENGMILSSDRYGIAENCMSCHGMNHSGLDGDTLAKMLGAGHPLKTEFELVLYSQGTVRHRFYPPNVNQNAEMTAQELARLFVEGQAAKLVSATDALSKSSDAKYQEAQKKRAADASSALSSVKSVPEAAALLGDPNEANARKLVNAVAEKDLTSEVGGLLPDKSKYK